MPVENTIEKARAAQGEGNVLRAKEILKSSLGNYGFSPQLFLAYAETLLALDEPAQAGRYLFFSVQRLAKEHEEFVGEFLKKNSGEGYESIIRASPIKPLSKLSELPDYSQKYLRDLGAPEDISCVFSNDDGRWVLAGCLMVLLAVVAFAVIGLITVFQWVIHKP